MDILFIGHSLIEFFDWQDRFPAHRVANLGVAGESVEGLLSRIERITKKYPTAQLIFVMSGINNIAMEDFEFLGSYKKIIERLSTTYPRAQIFINSLLPTRTDFISDESIRNVNKSLKELAEDANAEYLDIYGLFIDNDGRAKKDYLLEDGVHLSNEGYAVWARAVDEIINQ